MGVSSYTDADISRILGDVSEDGTFLHTPSMIDVKRNYEFATKKLLSLQLHHTMLAEYFKAKRIPRGLRSQPRDCAYMNETEYRSRFEAISNRYAFDLMLLHMEFIFHDITKVKQLVTQVEIILKDNISGQDLDNLLDKQKEFLTKFRSELEDGKKRQWHRDVQDYTNNKVYNWGSPFNNQRRTKRNKVNSEETLTNVLENPQGVNNMDSGSSVSFLGQRTPQGDAVGGAAESMTGNVRTRNNRRNAGTPQTKIFKKK
ncbi:uncharacterized protein LOC130298066 [Hyla sarda]|nr:uncharacterized protein LOC130298066 [Hyla sarda]